MHPDPTNREKIKRISSFRKLAVITLDLMNKIILPSKLEAVEGLNELHKAIKKMTNLNGKRIWKIESTN